MSKTIYLSGIHFHDLQAAFEAIPGIIDSRVGYANSTVAFPKYEDVLTGNTQATMAVKLVFDDAKISIHDIVCFYLDCVPLRREPIPYQRKGIYYDDLLDGVAAEVALVEHAGKDHNVEILKICNFFPAEHEHQHYLKSNPPCNENHGA